MPRGNGRSENHVYIAQVILIEINLLFHQLSQNLTTVVQFFTQIYMNCFVSWTNWVNSGKFMDNCWTISCQAMAYIKKVYIDLIIINLYSEIWVYWSNTRKALEWSTYSAVRWLEICPLRGNNLGPKGTDFLDYDLL